jgi:hypothetical protein
MAKNENTAPEPVWAVLVVHGVGFTRPGQTLESFLSGLRTLSGNHLEEIGPPEVLMLDKAQETLPPHAHAEHRSDSEIPLRDRFPMHRRRTRIENPRAGTPGKAVFAEVFWSDISRTHNQTLSILLRLVTIVFQLRFVVDRAAAPPDGSARWFRFVAYLASMVLCGPIAALNVMILILLLIHYAALKIQGWTSISLSGDQIHGALLLLGLLGVITAALITVYKHGERSDNPWRLLTTWSCAGSLALAVLAVYKIITPDAAVFPGAADRLLQYAVEFRAPPDALSFYFFSLLVLVRWSFHLLFTLLLLAIAAWLWSYLKACRAGKKELLPGLTAAVGLLILQIGLWVVLIPAIAIWVLQQLSMEDWVSLEGPFGHLQPSLVLNLALAAIVVACAVISWIRCRQWVRRHAKDSKNYSDLDTARTIPRLLISKIIFAGLLGASLLGILFGPVMDIAASEVAKSYTAWITGGVAALMTLVGLLLLSSVGSALHILMDIISHFIMARLPIPWPWGNEKKPQLKDLVRQMKIEARFRRVLEEMLSEGAVSHLTVVSHSQGSVIALDVLWYDWAADLIEKTKVKNLFLVTMGSPFTHLYQHYFPARYPALFLNGSFNSDPASGWGRLYKTFTSEDPKMQTRGWINLFRVDDPIGTQINEEGVDPTGSFPKNFALGPGGHTNYWCDQEALKKMKDLLPS